MGGGSGRWWGGIRMDAKSATPVPTRLGQSFWGARCQPRDGVLACSRSLTGRFWMAAGSLRPSHVPIHVQPTCVALVQADAPPRRGIISKSQSRLQPVLILAVAMALSATAVHGQSKTSSFSNDDLRISVSEPDRSSADSAVRVYKHLNYARTPAGMAARSKAGASRQSTAASATDAAAGIAGDDFTQNPGDVTYQGGPTVQYAVSHAVYLNPGEECTIASCWGDPEGFLNKVGASDFIRILDQYVGLEGNHRYTRGPRAVLTGALSTIPLSESDLIAILHGVVARTRAGGYENIYHLFLPPGVDTCFDAPSNDECYSPDNPATFVFCAYHDSVTYTDLGHVLFTVEPWQGSTSGCEDSPVGAPNSQLIDSTDDTLSHELFETISDPDGTAWWNATDLSLYGNEMADECLFIGPDNYFAEPTFPIDGHLYRVQSEYSNHRHACAITPRD